MESLNTTQPFAVFHDSVSTFIGLDGVVRAPIRQSGMVPLGTNSRQGFQNPSHRSQCANGVNATTPFVGVQFDGNNTFVSFYSIGDLVAPNGKLVGFYDMTSAGFLQPNGVPVAINVPTSVITDVTNRCIKGYIAEANAAMSSENLTGRSIKHFKHDIHSTLHPMTAIRGKISDYLTSLEKVKYGKLKGPSLLNAISSSYLEFKFGVEPFVQDITDILTDLVIKDRKRTPTVPIESTASQTYSGTVTVVPWINAGYANPFDPQQGRSVTDVFSVRMKGAMRTDTGMDGRVGFIQDNRLLPSDWAPTIASILPYAWMVSYFSNVRDIIDGISFRYSNMAWGCKTTRASSTYHFSSMVCATPNPFNQPPNIMNYATVISGGSSTYTYKSIQRSSINSGDLVPRIEFTIPSSPTPWLNMMAAFLPRIVKVAFN